MNKTQLILLLMCCLSLHTSAQNADSLTTKKVYLLEMREEVAPALWRKTNQALNEANKLKADFFLIHMNTYGGLVESADSIRTALLNSDIPTMVFIDNNAASAGALIAISCDSIYMRPGANMGAATVVNQTGEAVPDKYQSYMRSTMRSTAEAHGGDTLTTPTGITIQWHRDPKIAEAMVDPRMEIPGVIEKDMVLTFTTSEAMKNGYCEGSADNIEQLLPKIGITSYQITKYEPTRLENIMGWLVSPYLQSILIMIIIGGIYFELQTPGVGFPLAAAAVAAVLYFAPLYLEGLAANWEILLFVAGIILIAVELFVIPGFGIAGISGIILAVLGLALSLNFNPTFELSSAFLRPLLHSLAFVSISAFVSLGLSIYLTSRILKSENTIFSNISLRKAQNKEDGYVSYSNDLQKFIGKTADTITVLRPTGKILLKGNIYDAMSVQSYIEPDTEVEILRFEAGQFYVKRKDN